MYERFQNASLASLPPEQLAALTDLRALPGVRILLQETRHWLRWDGLDERILKTLLPLPGITLYEEREGHWHAVGAHLPAFDVPAHGGFQPLHDVIFPAPVTPLTLDSPKWEMQTLRLVADHVSRPASGMTLDLAEFAAWVDSVPSSRLHNLRWAVAGTRVLLLGKRLPPVRDGSRYWGGRVLTPLGFRPHPHLPEPTLRYAMKLEEDEWLILHEDDVEVIPDAAFRPVTRANVRATAEGVKA